jgi:hypothetical protein
MVSASHLQSAALRRCIDNTMVKAIARAFRWRTLLETGTHTTVAEIAAAEKTMRPTWVASCG